MNEKRRCDNVISGLPYLAPKGNLNEYWEFVEEYWEGRRKYLAQEMLYSRISITDGIQTILWKGIWWVITSPVVTRLLSNAEKNKSWRKHKLWEKLTFYSAVTFYDWIRKIYWVNIQYKNVTYEIVHFNVCYYRKIKILQDLRRICLHRSYLFRYIFHHATFH
jgi:hypothetical protein